MVLCRCYCHRRIGSAPSSSWYFHLLYRPTQLLCRVRYSPTHALWYWCCCSVSRSTRALCIVLRTQLLGCVRLCYWCPMTCPVSSYAIYYAVSGSDTLSPIMLRKRYARSLVLTSSTPLPGALSRHGTKPTRPNQLQNKPLAVQFVPGKLFFVCDFAV